MFYKAYEDNKDMKNILIFSKILMKSFSERTDKYVHPFDTRTDVVFAGLFYDKVLITLQRLKKRSE